MTDQVAALTSGLSGRYHVEREIGAGGMATVYLAHDLKHHRPVALKILRPELSALLGADRFLKEIEVTANLQHPHILPLHDSGEAAGFLFYVMPYVGGESLRQRLIREKQLGIAEAIQITTQVASALDYAHRHSVIHRDIKPENVLLHEGQALVTDFGIALALRQAGGNRLTETGLSLGTPQYMSPEQASGDRALDARTDVYSLGCVLYEMLAGEPPHTGPTVQAVIVKLMTDRPRPVTDLRGTVPVHVAAALDVALAKLPADRFATAAEFSDALTHPETGMASGSRLETIATSQRDRWDRWIRDPRSLGALMVAAIGMLWGGATWLNGGGGIDAGDVTSLSITLPDSIRDIMMSPSARVAISPDDRWVAFTGQRGAENALILRRLDRFDVILIPNGGTWPSFSVDGRTLGFLRASTEVWSTNVDRIAPALRGRVDVGSHSICGMEWQRDGSIVICASGGIWVLPPGGGEAHRAIDADTTRREGFSSITGIPDGRFLFVSRDSARNQLIGWADPTTGKRSLAETLECYGVFSRGWLITAQGARRIDPSSLQCSGAPLLGAAGADFARARNWTASRAGSVAWLTAVPVPLGMVWVTRQGEDEPVSDQLPTGVLRWPRLAPEGRRIAVRVAGVGLQVINLTTNARTTLSNPVAATEPVWLPDGSGVVTAAGDAPHQGLLMQPADGRRAPPPFLRAEYESWPTSIHPRENLLLFYGSTGAAADLYVMKLGGGEQPYRIPLAGDQKGGRFSPDGRWIAYQSDASGRWQVMVMPWPVLDAEFQVSVDGGTEPIWAADGSEIFFRNGNRVMSARVLPGPSFAAAPPAQLFEGPYAQDVFGDQSWDLAPDGRFLMLKPLRPAELEVRMIKNFVASLERERRGT